MTTKVLLPHRSPARPTFMKRALFKINWSPICLHKCHNTRQKWLSSVGDKCLPAILATLFIYLANLFHDSDQEDRFQPGPVCKSPQFWISGGRDFLVLLYWCFPFCSTGNVSEHTPIWCLPLAGPSELRWDSDEILQVSTLCKLHSLGKICHE